jgi:hypothetical protein
MNKNKNLYSLSLIFALLVLVLSGCADDFQRFEDKYVAFNSNTAVLNESQTVLTADGGATIANATHRVQVTRSAADVSQPLTVNIAVTSQYLEDSDFGSPGEDASDMFTLSREVSSLTIPAGAYTAEFLVISANDIIPSGDKEIVLEIVGVSDNSYNLGIGESNMRKKMVITLVDDDCPIDIDANLAGTWEVLSICGAPGSTNAGVCIGSQVGKQSTFTKDPSDPIGTTGIMTGGMHKDPFVIKFNTCPQTVGFSGAYELNFNQSGSAAFIRPLAATDPARFGTTGSYSESTKRISVFFRYSNAGGSNFDVFIVTYQKVEE